MLWLDCDHSQEDKHNVRPYAPDTGRPDRFFPAGGKFLSAERRHAVKGHERSERRSVPLQH